MPQSDTELLGKLEGLKDILISRALGISQRKVEYETLRGSLLHTQRVASQLPAFVRTCKTLDAFWIMISQEHKVPADRKRHIQRMFRPVVTMLAFQGKKDGDALPRYAQQRSKSRPVRAFLCHSSGDKPAVRNLHGQLLAAGIQPWLDEVDILPGQEWEQEIRKAVRDCDVVVVCLSPRSAAKDGFVQKEIGFALDRAEEKPEGTIYIIPLRLEECVVPDRLRRWHWVDLYKQGGFERLLSSLKGHPMSPGPRTTARAFPRKEMLVGTVASHSSKRNSIPRTPSKK